MNPVDIVQAALDDLPGSSGEIAAKFQANGICGRLESAWYCPISEYLRQRLTAAGDTNTFVGTTGTEVIVGRGPGGKILPAPASVKHFVNRFDDELYPELIIPGRTIE